MRNRRNSRRWSREEVRPNKKVDRDLGFSGAVKRERGCRMGGRGGLAGEGRVLLRFGRTDLYAFAS